MNQDINKEFHEVLIRDDDIELKKFIQRHGKTRKPVSPVFFVLKEESIEPLFYI